jgi:hypothetical protein
MKLLKTIVRAVYFDDTLDRVLAAASALAKKFDSEVVLTHVVEAADESGQVPESLQTTSHQANRSQMPRSECHGVNASREEFRSRHGRAEGDRPPLENAGGTFAAPPKLAMGSVGKSGQSPARKLRIAMGTSVLVGGINHENGHGTAR